MPRPDIQFDADAHSYLVNGVAVPSVTQIIKETVGIPFSAGAWYGYKMGVEAGREVDGDWKTPEEYYAEAKAIKNPNSELRNAGDRGNYVHDWLDAYATEGNCPAYPIPFEFQTRINGVQSWLEENDPRFIETEVRTASIEHGYAGTLDALVEFRAGKYEGAVARIDYKTSKSVYPDQHFPQLAAYEWAERECGQVASDVQLVIHIPESGKVKMVRSTDTFAQFEVLLLHYMSNQVRKLRAKDA